jgi:hypothetical protein
MILHADDVRPDLGGRRNLLYVGNDLRRQSLRMQVMDELQPIDEESWLLAQRHSRPPFLPTIVSSACIERRSKNTDRNASSHFIPSYKLQDFWIIIQASAQTPPEAKRFDYDFLL